MPWGIKGGERGVPQGVPMKGEGRTEGEGSASRVLLPLPHKIPLDEERKEGNAKLKKAIREKEKREENPTLNTIKMSGG